MAPSAEGRVVVVTGANEGIGYHLLTALLDDGYRVAGLDVDVEHLRTLRERHPDHLRFHECDVTVDEDVETAVGVAIEEWGRIDVLVNNAAILNFGFFEDQTPADARRVLEVNFFGYLRTVRAVLPHMRARDEGIIHNVSSGVDLLGNPGLSGYAASKGAVEAFTRSLRFELQETNVACTLMHPRLANTRSAATVFPASTPGMRSPAEVGRALAEKVESTRPVVYVDWTTRIGLFLARLFPVVVRRGTRRFLDEREAAAARHGG